MSVLRRWLACAGGLFILLASFWCPPARADGGSVVWQRADGPWGGAVRALAIDPQRPSTLYAGTTCGVYQSNDSGNSWSQVGDGEISCQDITLLAIDPANPKILYAVGHTGLFRTNDQGKAWKRIDRSFTGHAVSALALDPSLQGVIYVAVQGTIWKSADYGQSWNAHDVAFPSEIVWSLMVDPSDSQHLYAGTLRGLYHSRDGAETWETISAVQVPVRAMATSPASPARLYLATDQGLMQSLDSAVTWQVLDSARTSPATAIVAHPTDDRALFSIQGSRNLLRSQDQGRTFSPLLSLSASQFALAAAIDPYDSQRLYLGTTLGLYTSVDGGETWDTSIGGIAANEVRKIIDAPRTKGQLYVLTPGGIMETTDEGKTWQGRNHGLAETEILALGVDPQDRRMLYAITSSGNSWRSENGGAQWELTEGALPKGAQTNRLVVWHAKDASGPVLYVATENQGVFRSPDEGKHWQPLTQGLPSAPARGLVFLQGRQSYVYVGAGPDIYRLPIDASADEGAQWERVTAEPLNAQVNDLCVLSHRRHTLYASTEAGGIYRQNQEGAAWESLSAGIVPFAVPAKVLWVSDRPGRRPVLWAITDAGLFYSQDEGTTWALSKPDEMQQGNVRCLATDDLAAGNLYVGTTRSGLYHGRPATAPLASKVGYFVLAAVVFGSLVGLIKGRDILHQYWQGRSRLLLEQNWQTWNTAIDEAIATHNLVTPESLDRIPPDWRLVAMRSYVQTRKDRALVYGEQPSRIEPERIGDLQKLAAQWAALVERSNDPAAAIPVATQLTEQLCTLLGFEPLEGRTFRSLFGYMVQAPTLRLGIPSRFPVIYAFKPQLQRADIRDIRDLMTVLNATSFFALLVLVDQAPASKEQVRETTAAMKGRADDLIVLDYQDLRNLFLATDVRRSLVDAILKQADLALVSPYVTSGPVADNMFFGRDYEIKAILRTIRERNYAIIGGRKIGKTSMLTKIHRLLEETGGFHAYYMDCEHIFDYSQFLSSLVLACQSAGTPKTIEDIRHLVICVRRQHGGGTIVFLFDEIDHLLAFDRQNQDRLFGLLRALATEGLCRMVFCGEKVMHRAFHDHSHPLRGMVNVIELGYLSHSDALRVVTEPMDTMGVTFERTENLPQKIVALSSGHPNLVQAICHMLINRVNERGDRVIWAHDLSMVRNSDEFREFALEVLWSDTSTVGRLITVLMAHTSTFTIEDARMALRERGYEISHAAMKEVLDELTLLSVLRRRGLQYTYLARSLSMIMSDANLASGFSEALVEELRDEEPQAFAAPPPPLSPQSRDDGAR